MSKNKRCFDRKERKLFYLIFPIILKKSDWTFTLYSWWAPVFLGFIVQNGLMRTQ